MPRLRFHALVVGLLVVATLTCGAGCDPLTSHLATFGAGYLVGRLSGPPVGVVTTERVCYEAGKRVPCP